MGQMNTVNYRVKMDDGTMVDIPVAADLPPEKLAGVIEGSLRARARVKQGRATQPNINDNAQPAPGTSWLDSLKPTSLLDSAKSFAGGVVHPAVEMFNNFKEGLGDLNSDPVGTLSGVASALKPQVGPMGGQIPGMWAPISTNTDDGVMGNLADTVKALPVVGPIADAAGKKAATGDVAGATGNITGEVLANWLAAKGANGALERAKTATLTPTVDTAPPNVTAPGQSAVPGGVQYTSTSRAVPGSEVLDATAKVYPEAGPAAPLADAHQLAVTNTLREGSGGGGRLSTSTGRPALGSTIDFGKATDTSFHQAAEDLRRQLEGTRAGPPSSSATGITNTPVGRVGEASSLTTPASADNIRVRLPMRAGPGGAMIPVYLEVPKSGAVLDAIKRFASTAKGSAAETMWLQRVLHYATRSNDQGSDGVQAKPQEED